MIIFIKTIDKKYKLEINQENYIMHIKDKIYESLKIHPNQQRLIFNGSPMVTEYTLKQQGVEENSVIHLLMTLM
jgi:hypothetical protein